MELSGKRVLLIIGGGIAAYKALELIRRLKDAGASVHAILTAAGAQFITSLSVSALSGERTYQELFDLTVESEMGHIALSRAADLLVVAPATADLMAKLAVGLAPDLASTALLATDKPVLLAPAMNVRMWQHPATRRNLAALTRDGIHIVGPNDGEMACGEFGQGRMAEPAEILAAITAILKPVNLAGIRALVTAGPTHEPIDPVRYLGNRSSGKQGYAIAEALFNAGAETVLVSGPVALTAAATSKLVRVETAIEMRDACEAALPVDIAICAAAVADWHVEHPHTTKLKKPNAPPSLVLVENPDILAELSHHPTARPKLVIGFAAETGNLLVNAAAKRAAKGCDWIIANDVSTDTQGKSVMGSDSNRVHLLSEAGAESWPLLSKRDVAQRLTAKIAQFFGRAA
ncbi:MAG: bifunctional phosphopantothenoylcysteine decarboxylase/phosphopantothenate--cysteine ligase CoaBC [Alphaproteobacteria bacterium]|nr:bifunctional phosphopantothenoylcysteine decarboxylase/phosphopantothenate--cysteine ligase CoaBC [Alphaproteobacteria bacterium]